MVIRQEVGDQFNPNRLAIVLARRRVSLTKLSEMTKIRRYRLARYSRGIEEPPRDDVEEIARALDWPIRFFFMDDIDMPHQASHNADSR